MTVSKGIEILATKLCEEMDALKQLENEVKEKKKIIHQIKSKDLAEIVDAEGYQVGSKIALSNGRSIMVKEFFAASIPSLSAIAKEKDPEKQLLLQERREKGFSWLDENGKGDVIKNTVTAKFKREEGEKAKALVLWLNEKSVEAVRDENVHPATLVVTLKEAMGNGESVPLDTFQVYRGVVVDAK